MSLITKLFPKIETHNEYICRVAYWNKTHPGIDLVRFLLVIDCVDIQLPVQYESCISNQTRLKIEVLTQLGYLLDTNKRYLSLPMSYEVRQIVKHVDIKQYLIETYSELFGMNKRDTLLYMFKRSIKDRVLREQELIPLLSSVIVSFFDITNGKVEFSNFIHRRMWQLFEVYNEQVIYDYLTMKNNPRYKGYFKDMQRYKECIPNPIRSEIIRR